MSLFQWLDDFGVVVFAISGALAAGRKRLDPFGVLVVAFITALGGGTLRDVLLGAHPVAWIAHPAYLALVFGATVITLVLGRWWVFPVRALDVLDAVGLAFFTVLGAQKTLLAGHPPVVAVMMGMITGVAGGVVRDIICNEIPLIFRKEIYALAAGIGAGVYLLAHAFAATDDLAVTAGMGAGLAVRLLAIYRGWSLPVVVPIERH